MRRPRSVAVALATAAALAGCNDAPRVGEEEQVATTVEALLKLCGERSPIGILDLLAEDSRPTFIKAGGVLQGCQAILRLGDTEDVPSPELYFDAHVTEVSRRGDQAEVEVRAGDDETIVHLLDTGLQWFVSNPPRYEPVGTDDIP